MLGKLEEVIILATMRTGGNAVPSAIYEKIIESTPPGGKEQAFGAVYTTLNRMAAKGLLVLGGLVDERGRERRTFTVSATGRQAVQAAHHQLQALGGLQIAGAL